MIQQETLFSLENADLSTLLMPTWVKENSRSSLFPAQDQGPQDQKNSTSHFRNPLDRGRNEGRSQHSFRDRGDKNHRNPSSFSKKQPYAPSALATTVPVFSGWKIEFLPEQRALDEIAKKIKLEAKAYPLFELARLLLEKPERYCLRCLKIPNFTKNASKLYQSLLDESLWMSEKELIAHVLKNYRDRYYLTETIEVEPPKGSYSSLAVCGMSQKILGPSNHHEYQAKIRQLHATCFSHIPFEVFKSRITMVRDEAMMEAWKKEESVRETFLPRDLIAEGDAKGSSRIFHADRDEEAAKPGGASQNVSLTQHPSVFPDSAVDQHEISGLTLPQLEMHFKKAYSANVMAEIKEEVFLPGVAGITLSDSSIKTALQQALQDLRRFPLPLAHLLGEELTTRGLHVFKAHENILYVSIARPRALTRMLHTDPPRKQGGPMPTTLSSDSSLDSMDAQRTHHPSELSGHHQHDLLSGPPQQETPLSAPLTALIYALETHRKNPRSEQWKAMVASRSLNVDQTEAERESAVAKDLSWLIHEGYVINYALRGFALAKRSHFQTPVSVSHKEKYDNRLVTNENS